MADFDLVLRGRRVITRAGEVPRCIAVRDGVVVADDEVLLPGLVDSHVHVNEPGRTEWEGFATATRAAAAGGVTTIMDMPLNSVPPTTTARGLEAKVAAAEGKCSVDVAICGGLVPDNAHAEGALASIASSGALAFKCF